MGEGGETGGCIFRSVIFPRRAAIFRIVSSGNWPYIANKFKQEWFVWQ